MLYKLAGSLSLSVICLVSALGATQVLAQLPDFTSIVEQRAGAVVKITTITHAKSQQYQPDDRYNNGQQLPEIFREYFERHDQSRSRESRSSGSGFIVSADGYILTNNHVIEDADEIVVRMVDRREFNAEVVGTDQRSDLALLKVAAKDLPVLKMASSDNLKVGEWVLAIGSPFGLDYSVSSGIVSAIGRSIRDGGGSTYVPFIQTDVAINPGNSGGPLFNMSGEVVGINSQIYSPSGGSVGLSFAIPVGIAVDVMAQLKESGSVSRGWLGVGIQDVDKDLAESFGLDSPKGALISYIELSGPAAAAGVKVGDIIIDFNGTAIGDSADLPAIVGLTKPGKKISMVVVRDGFERNLSVKVGTLDGGKAGAILTSGDSSDLNEVDKLGLLVKELTQERQEAEQIAGGVVVVKVETGSAGAMARLRSGDIITLVGGYSISTLKEFEKVVSKLPPGKHVPMRIVRNGSAGFVAIQVPR
ncbi:MAG: serine protease Do [Flavobacteriales bacterium]|jgi:serine protease Do